MVGSLGKELLYDPTYVCELYLSGSETEEDELEVVQKIKPAARDLVEKDRQELGLLVAGGLWFSPLVNRAAAQFCASAAFIESAAGMNFVGRSVL